MDIVSTDHLQAAMEKYRNYMDGKLDHLESRTAALETLLAEADELLSNGFGYTYNEETGEYEYSREEETFTVTVQ